MVDISVADEGIASFEEFVVKAIPSRKIGKVAKAVDRKNSKPRRSTRRSKSASSPVAKKVGAPRGKAKK